MNCDNLICEFYQFYHIKCITHKIVLKFFKVSSFLELDLILTSSNAERRGKELSINLWVLAIYQERVGCLSI